MNYAGSNSTDEKILNKSDGKEKGAMMSEKNIDPEKLAEALVRKYGLETVEDLLLWIDLELEKLNFEQTDDIMTALDMADAEVDLMDRYPDAEYMLAKLKKDYL